MCKSLAWLTVHKREHYKKGMPASNIALTLKKMGPSYKGWLYKGSCGVMTESWLVNDCLLEWMIASLNPTLQCLHSVLWLSGDSGHVNEIAEWSPTFFLNDDELK